jgi:hypothetical protein
MADNFPKSDRVDIMLLLEGTFPYVSGGVSSWVNQMIRGFPQYSFGAVFIGSSRSDYGELKYKLPENLIHLETYYLQDSRQKPEIRPMEGNQIPFETVKRMHAWFLNPKVSSMEDAAKDLDFYLDPLKGIDHAQFLYSTRAWDLITELYQRRCSDPSFVDYFWTTRNMHAPIWTMAEIASQLIPAIIRFPPAMPVFSVHCCIIRPDALSFCRSMAFTPRNGGSISSRMTGFRIIVMPCKKTRPRSAIIAISGSVSLKQSGGSAMTLPG